MTCLASETSNCHSEVACPFLPCHTNRTNGADAKLSWLCIAATRQEKVARSFVCARLSRLRWGRVKILDSQEYRLSLHTRSHTLHSSEMKSVSRKNAWQVPALAYSMHALQTIPYHEGHTRSLVGQAHILGRIAPRRMVGIESPANQRGCATAPCCRHP